MLDGITTSPRSRAVACAQIYIQPPPVEDNVLGHVQRGVPRFYILYKFGGLDIVSGLGIIVVGAHADRPRWIHPAAVDIDRVVAAVGVRVTGEFKHLAELYEMLVRALLRIDQFEAARTYLRTLRDYRSPLFQAEFQAAFGTLCAAAGQFRDATFTRNIELLKESPLGNNHPLAALLAERYGWSLLDQWKVSEAEEQFREALMIRAANQRDSGDPLAIIPVWFDWHALASTSKLLSRYFIGIIIESTVMMLVVSIALICCGYGVSNAFFIGLIIGILNVIPYVVKIYAVM